MDQNRDGIILTVAYALVNGLQEGDQLAYCEAAESGILQSETVRCLSIVYTTLYSSPPKRMNDVLVTCSRHAVLLNWDGGIWVHTKTRSEPRSYEEETSVPH